MQMMHKIPILGGLLAAAAVAMTASPGSRATGAAADGPQLAHMVYFKLKDTSGAARAKLARRLQALPHRPRGHGLLRRRHPRRRPERARSTTMNFDVSLHLVFANKAAHDKYQEHPRHLKFVEENKENWEKVRVFDSYLSPAPPRRAASGPREVDLAGVSPQADRVLRRLKPRLHPLVSTARRSRAAARSGVRTRTGNGGRAGGLGGGFLASSSSTTSMARSSCGSLPAATAAGSCSTSMSGGTPTFSTTQPSSVKIARFGRRDDAAVHQVGKPRMPTRPPQVRLPTSLPRPNLRNIHGKQVAARAGRLVDDHHLGAEDRRVRRADRLAVAGRPVADQRPAEHVRCSSRPPGRRR